MKPKLDRGIMIGELIMNYPQAVEVLFEHGFHCIGCGLSAYETLGQGCAAHGFDDEMVGKLLEEIRKKVNEAERKEYLQYAEKIEKKEKEGKEKEKK